MHPYQTETLYLDLAFMLIGLGFFIFVMFLVIKFANQDNERDYGRTLNERREFGFVKSKLRKKGTILPPPQN